MHNAPAPSSPAGRRKIAYALAFTACWLGIVQFAAGGNPERRLDWSALDEMVELVQAKSNKPISSQEAQQMVLKGFMHELDSNSTYLTEQEWTSQQEEIAAQYVGIGISISKREDGMVVTELAPGGPAARAGVRVGDIIFDIDGALPPQTEEGVVRAVRGKEGTPVIITFLRPSLKINRTYWVEIIRGKVRTPTVFSGRHADTGLIQLKHFSETSVAEVMDALAGLLAGNNPVRQLVFDLRGNPGGLYLTGIELAALLLPDDATVSRTFHRGENQESYRVTPIGLRTSDGKLATATNRRFPQLISMPLAIVVDRTSASSSEVFTAALMDYGRAVVVGEKTYGKGTMQSLLPMSKALGMAKLTTQEFRSPNGHVIDRIGITPDVPVKQAPRDDGVVEAHNFTARDFDPANPDPMLAKAIEVVERFRRNAEVNLSRQSATHQVPKH